MKTIETIKTLVIATLAVTTMSNAWSATKETDQEISAQTTITRGHIDNLLERINNRTIDTTFRANDYLSQTQDFKNKVEASLSIFEQTLEKDILPKASYWMDQYNAIYKSTSYSEDQKRILLGQRLSNIQAQLAKLSVDYQNALAKVYVLIPLAGKTPQLVVNTGVKIIDMTVAGTENLKAEYILNEKIHISRTYSVVIKKESWRDKRGDAFFQYKGVNEKISTSTGYGWIEFGDGWKTIEITPSVGFSNEAYNSFNFMPLLKAELKTDLFQKYVYSEVKGSACKSQICLGLKAGDYSSLLTMINTMLDRNLQFKLADGTPVYLTSLRQDVSYTLEMLARVDYPEELPFEY